MAEISTTQSFADGDTVTAAKLNNITANASVGAEVITNRSELTSVDGATDFVLGYDTSAAGLRKIKPDNLPIANGTVTTAKLADSAVTTAKVNDGAITTAKINNAAVTSAKVDTTGVAVLGTAQSFTTAHGFAASTLVEGTSIAWDLSANQVARVTLAGNRTLANPTNKVEGNVYILTVKQDGTGSRTLSFDTDYKFAGGSAPTLTTTANKADVLTFVCEGTNLLGVASQSFL